MTATLEEFSGVIPPPIMLKQYDEIEPGIAKKVLLLYEEQVRHRIQSEKKVIEYLNRQITRSQWFAFIATSGLIIAGVIVAILLTRNGEQYSALAVYLV